MSREKLPPVTLKEKGMMLPLILSLMAPTIQTTSLMLRSEGQAEKIAYGTMAIGCVLVMNGFNWYANRSIRRDQREGNLQRFSK